MIFYLFLKYVNRLKMLVAHVDVRYIRGLSGTSVRLAEIRNFHKRAWCVSAFAREEERAIAGWRERGREGRERAAGASECEKRFSISRCTH